MISVLIPIYNNDVEVLVKTLSQQLINASINNEILLLDDASSESIKKKNRQVSLLYSCSYQEHEVNKGRVTSRLSLAQQAKYPWLLFIDADCIIDKEDYIHQYIQYLNRGNDVLIGGTTYPLEILKACDFHLHWKYGKVRIATQTVKSNTYAADHYKGFLFNNVLMKKEVFLQLSFPHIFEGYGHEDTWVGIELEEKRATVEKLNNPVLHPQLDTASVFIDKNLNALRNLKQLASIKGELKVSHHVKIYRYYLLLKKFRLTYLFDLTLATFKSKIIENLKSCRPSLVLFDLLRLYHLNRLMKH